MNTIIEMSDKWADEVWDEDGIPAENRTPENLIRLSKSAGSLGYACGIKEVLRRAVELSKLSSIAGHLPIKALLELYNVVE